MTAPTPPAPALVRPFAVSVPDSEIEDLKQRLARTRWPDPETTGDWSQGVRVANARSLAGYWERGYDWRRLESGLNRFPQFLTAIDGRLSRTGRTTTPRSVSRFCTPTATWSSRPAGATCTRSS